MRLLPERKIRVAGKDYAVHGPVYEAVKQYFETIQRECAAAQRGVKTEGQAISTCKGMSDRVLEEL